MKYDEFAFFNQQLAAMLRDGIPLEGALHQLCANMGRGELRSELQLLEADLAKGTPLKAAMAARKLPSFYVQMVEVGVAGNDLPGVLLMLADHYERTNLVWTRLKGLMVYPMMVLCAGLVLSSFLTFLCLTLVGSLELEPLGFQLPAGIAVNLWAPPILIGTIFAAAVAGLTVPRFRQALRWRLPAFKEANLSRVAGAMWLVLKSGGNLGDALKLMQELESGSKAGRELAQWHTRMAGGRGKFSELASPGSAFPPLFVWLVTNSGEDLATGFERAAEIYSARARHRTELFLYAALPFTVVILGTMIVGQILPLVSIFTGLMNGFDGLGM
ncbi:MAG: Type secretion system protein [Pedosphaera sp.]|nr:Type secretion system protein [Pedosphaera sp.]